ncbi:thermonuclease family protein [Microbacterium gallinarum]|uniref:Thermonuclease family protein n=1 Tax=Microbacterium gallinarum TaxID=2762209 RepID=A0ABR8X3I4_9MICO|nr:thermonuclease family protein [Microbacterium gallinarum]MBD8023682.1 thermonuclease family protein [Microbacterium gallinarum]
MARNTLAGIGLAAAIAIIVTGCAAEPSVADVVEPAAAPTALTTPTPTALPTAPAQPAPDLVTFVEVIDGDTIETSAGTVRIIGIDTPERGECGDVQAAAAISGMLSAGDAVELGVPAGQNDQDRHGRLIRYVATASGVDLGLMQLEAGNAVARYDSRDGYPAHPRETAYHASQVAALGPDGAVVTVACRQTAPVAPPTGDGWWEQYSSCTKLKKNSVGHPTGPFSRDDPSQAGAYDWFAIRTGNNGDGDGDGLACE